MRKHPVAAPATATCRPTYLSCATGDGEGEDGGVISENKASAIGGEDGEGEEGGEGGVISENKAPATLVVSGQVTA